MDRHFKVLELYSGIGGMHYAIKESGLTASIVAAVDINEVANSVYKHNFPSVNLLQRNITSLQPKEINGHKPDVIMMSPPCQPFTRVGLKKDVEDGRTNSFIHLLSVLPELHTVQYILMENVKGFEASETRNKFISVLDNIGFIYQECLLSPHSFLVPNMRLRYYLLAKRKPRDFPFPVSPQLLMTFPFSEIFEDYPARNNVDIRSCEALIASVNKKFFEKINCSVETVDDKNFTLKNILETNMDENSFILNPKTLAKYAQILDIVTPESKKSCCFTKAYGHYVEGTGSVLCPFSERTIHEVYEQCKELEPGSNDYVNVLRKLKLRYFTPREISRLMCFPEEFSFPESSTVKQKYRLLGNSVNVHVVAILFVLLVYES